jgi:hypothetical protein
MDPERKRGRGPTAPVITVNRGQATDAEIAAVTAVLFAVRSAAEAASVTAAVDAAAAARAPRQSLWAERGRPGSAPTLPRPRPHAWRAAALPH